MIRRDATGFGDLDIFQDDEFFCYGVDAVMIASFAAEFINRKKGMDSAADLGTGNGIIPLILAHKTKLSHITGIEINEKNVLLAEKTAAENNLEERLSFVKADVSEICGDSCRNEDKDGYEGEKLDFMRPDVAGAYANGAKCDEREGADEPSTSPEFKAGSFDAVVSNPPYIAKQGGVHCDADAKTVARHEVTADLNDFLKAASYLLKTKGELYMIHKAFRSAEITIKAASNRLELKDIRFVSGKKETDPELVMMRLVKDGRPGVKVLSQLHIREDDGEFSEEILDMYERAK